MRILQVVSTPPYAWASGGCARVVYEVSKALVKMNHHVTILTTDLYEPKKRYDIKNNPEYIDGIEVYRFKLISNYLAWKYKFYLSPGIITYLKHHLREYDIVHLQDLISLHAIATAYYCKVFGIPYVITTHGSLPWLKTKKGFNRIFNRLFANKILNNSSKVFVLNKTEEKQCNDRGIILDKIKIEPNGIDLQEYGNLPTRGIFRKKYGINNDEKIVLYLGRIHKTKGIDLLLNSFSNVKDKLDTVKLILVGPNDGYKKELKLLIKSLNIESQIIFTGFVSSEEKMQALVDADVFVTPNFSGFPVTFVESCACGTPIITTDKGDKLDWIDNNVGFVVEPDKKSIAEAIIKILKDDSLRKKFSENSLKIVEMRFNWKKISSDLEQIYYSSFHDIE